MSPPLSWDCSEYARIFCAVPDRYSFVLGVHTHGTETKNHARNPNIIQNPHACHFNSHLRDLQRSKIESTPYVSETENYE